MMILKSSTRRAYSSTMIYQNSGKLDSTFSQMLLILKIIRFEIFFKKSIFFNRTYGGVLQRKEEPHVVTVPTLMWIKALDMILDKLRVCGVDFSRVASISGCAQVKHIFLKTKIDNNFHYASTYKTFIKIILQLWTNIMWLVWYFSIICQESKI